eukprot:3843062-Rhodomonas_salina.1
MLPLAHSHTRTLAHSPTLPLAHSHTLSSSLSSALPCMHASSSSRARAGGAALAVRTLPSELYSELAAFNSKHLSPLASSTRNSKRCTLDSKLNSPPVG